jgi:hypothetical protein
VELIGECLAGQAVWAEVNRAKCHPGVVAASPEAARKRLRRARQSGVKVVIKAAYVRDTRRMRRSRSARC